MKNERPPTNRRKASPQKMASRAGTAVGAIVLVCVLALLLFPDPLVNWFIKPRITKAFAEAYPAYSIRLSAMNFSVFKNRFGFDFVELRATDGTFSSNIGPFSVSGISWMHLLWGGSLAPNDFAKSEVIVHGIVLTFPPSHYELRCKRLSVSARDSEMVVEAVKLQPLGDDEQFFARSKFRNNRLRLLVPQARVMGLACLELLHGKNYRARSVQIDDASLDILLNQDKPDSRDTSGFLMPNEILSSIKGTLQVDRLSITNGQLKYAERFAVGAKPAIVTFDSMQVSAEGIANHGPRGAALVIHAQTKFVKAGMMKLNLTIPVASRECSFQYSGSLSGMDLRALNSFLEVSDHIRIKSGVLKEATYEINVVSGRASGTVRGVYRDLTLAAIDNEAGSEKGLSNAITSFIANALTIRRSNMPGSMKIGVVNYTRVRDDPFFQYEWFALRTGVRNVLGL
ncbi:MAG: hypothetical protein NTZ35_17890 [Ignavibacteriales bacterium]|nr:hypothetical protein [Ignavibacteriales bacterium]